MLDYCGSPGWASRLSTSQMIRFTVLKQTGSSVPERSLTLAHPSFTHLFMIFEVHLLINAIVCSCIKSLF